MRNLSENNEEGFNRQFKRYVDGGVGADDLEAVYKKAHAAIRKDPLQQRSPLEKGSFGAKRSKGKDKNFAYPAKRFNLAKTTIEQKKGRIRQKLTAKGVPSLAGFVWPPVAAADASAAAAAAGGDAPAAEEE